MANYPALILDVNGKPISQILNQMTNANEPLSGIGSASLTVRGRAFQVGASATTTVIPLLSSTGLTVSLSAAMQTQLIGGSAKFEISGTLYEMQIIAATASSITLDSPFPTAPAQGTNFVIVPPDQVSLTGSNVQNVTFVTNNVSAATPPSVRTNAKVEFEVFGTGTGFVLTPQLVMLNGSGQPVPTQAFSLATQSLVSTITANGAYEMDVAGWDQAELTVTTAPTSGNTSAAGKWVVVS